MFTRCLYLYNIITDRIESSIEPLHIKYLLFVFILQWLTSINSRFIKSRQEANPQDKTRHKKFLLLFLKEDNNFSSKLEILY